LESSVATFISHGALAYSNE